MDPVAAAGGDERGGHVRLVRDLVDVVQLFLQRLARLRGQQEVRARGPPEELGLLQALRQFRPQPRAHTGGPGRQVRVMPGRGQRVQHRGQLGQRRGGERHPLGRQAGDVDTQRHLTIIPGRTSRRPLG